MAWSNRPRHNTRSKSLQHDQCNSHNACACNSCNKKLRNATSSALQCTTSHHNLKYGIEMFRCLGLIYCPNLWDNTYHAQQLLQSCQLAIGACGPFKIGHLSLIFFGNFWTFLNSFWTFFGPFMDLGQPMLQSWTQCNLQG